MKPVVALDVDGALSPILKDSDFEDDNFYRWDLAQKTWPHNEDTDESPWIKTDCMDAYVARPVADFIREIASSGRAEVMWHSTWGTGAKRFEKALDLPDLGVLFGKYSKSPGGGSEKWSKLVDVEALLAEDRQVIWIDDHISRETVPAETLENLNLMCLAPGPGDIVGLSENDLYLIDRQLRAWGY